MTDDRRVARDQEQDRERSRKGSAAAAAGGLAAGGLAQREIIGDLLAGDGEDVIDTSSPAGIPDSSLDVFDDMQPADPSPTSGEGDPGSGMPLLRFDTPDVPPIPEDVASFDTPRGDAVPAELPDAEVPADVFNLMDVDVLDADSTTESDEPEPGDIDILL